MNTERNYHVCFVCTGNACRSPFAECVTKALLEKAGTTGIDVCSSGTLDWGTNPRDAAMADVAREMGYEMDGTTTHLTREALLQADLIVVFEDHHRNAVTQTLDYCRWERIAFFNQLAFGTDCPVEDPRCQAAEVYRRVAAHIEEGCRRIVAQWQLHPPRPHTEA